MDKGDVRKGRWLDSGDVRGWVDKGDVRRGRWVDRGNRGEVGG